MVFEDINGNGVRDIFDGELGLAGWTVQLVWNGQVIDSRTTDPNGNYQFDGLANDAPYEVCVVAQGNYNQTTPVGGSGCGGNGFAFSFHSSVPAQTAPLNFGEQLVPVGP